MKEKIAKLLADKKAAKIILVLGIVAIVLIFLSSVIDNEGKELPQKTEFSEAEYCKTIEDKISQIVQSICGDSLPTVTVTLDTGIVYEYASEIKEKGSKDEAKESAENEKSYITVKNKSGDEEPLIITSYMHKVRGVSVICNADDSQAQEIKNAACAALDISSRKIYIGRKSGQ